MIEVQKLDSGLTLIHYHIEDKYAVGMGIYVKTGSVNEHENEHGISHLLEHMHFKGTKNYSQKELAILIDSVGGNYNAFTSKDMTGYHMKVLAENAPKAASLIVDCVANSTFEQDGLEREKDVVIQEMKMFEDVPDDLLFEKMEEHVLKGTSYENRIIGTEESVMNLNREMLFDYKARHYVKDNMIVAVCSNKDESELFKIFEDGFSHFNKSGEKTELKKAEYKPTYINEVRNVEQSHLMLMMPGLPIGHEDTYARKLAMVVLGGSSNSRLFQNIREDRGLAYIIYASDYSMANTGLNYICSGLKHDKVADAIKEIRHELECLKAKGITQNEFELAKVKAKTAIAFSYEQAMNVTDKIAVNYACTNIIEDLDKKIKKIDSLTLEEVNEQAAILGATENYTVGLVSGKPMDVERIYNS